MTREPSLVITLSLAFLVVVSALSAQTTGALKAPQLNSVKASFSDPASSASIPSPQAAAAPTEIYIAKRGEAIPTIAHRYLGKTAYLTSTELADAIRQVNGDRTANVLKANENIIIPGILAAPIREKTIPVAKDFEVRARPLTLFETRTSKVCAVEGTRRASGRTGSSYRLAWK